MLRLLLAAVYNLVVGSGEVNRRNQTSRNSIEATLQLGAALYIAFWTVHS
jgi:hypothetical protein